MPHSRPAVLVLLATYNGEHWLDEQLSSIYAQRDVDITVVASETLDDSTEASLALVVGNGLRRLPRTLPEWEARIAIF